MKPNIYILMGVSATGKTTLGNALATATNGKFYDGDDYHPETNRQKMANGHPLDDSDRQPWLETLANLIAAHATQPTPTFIACSALKETYRETLRSKYPPLAFLHLTAPTATLLQRITQRHKTGQHFMPPSLLASQLETLETPSYALEMNVTQPIPQLVARFQKHYQ